MRTPLARQRDSRWVSIVALTAAMVVVDGSRDRVMVSPAGRWMAGGGVSATGFFWGEMGWVRGGGREGLELVVYRIGSCLRGGGPRAQLRCNGKASRRSRVLGDTIACVRFGRDRAKGEGGKLKGF